jgi:hypothetical protein
MNDIISTVECLTSKKKHILTDIASTSNRMDCVPSDFEDEICLAAYAYLSLCTGRPEWLLSRQEFTSVITISMGHDLKWKSTCSALEQTSDQNLQKIRVNQRSEHTSRDWF